MLYWKFKRNKKIKNRFNWLIRQHLSMFQKDLSTNIKSVHSATFMILLTGGIVRGSNKISYVK